MTEYNKLPWDIETTIENMQDMKEMFKQQLHKINFEGKGIEDGEELEFDFNRAIKALWKQVPKYPDLCSRFAGGICYQQEHLCNRCSHVIEKEYKYCPECGQAIDWRK